MKKLAAVNKDLSKKELCIKIGALDPYTTTKKVQTPLLVYILQCFMLNSSLAHSRLASRGPIEMDGAARGPSAWIGRRSMFRD